LRRRSGMKRSREKRRKEERRRKIGSWNCKEEKRMRQEEKRKAEVEREKAKEKKVEKDMERAWDAAIRPAKGFCCYTTPADRMRFLSLSAKGSPLT
jgi:hypothetical protein